MRDPMGNVIAPGWSSLNLPVSQDNGEGVSYQSLSAKVRWKWIADLRFQIAEVRRALGLL